MDWEPETLPEGELLELLDVLFIESNVFFILFVTALFMESERLWAWATCASDMTSMGIKNKPKFIESSVYQTIKGCGSLIIKD